MFNKQKWKGGGSLLLLFIQCSATEGLLASRREKLFYHIQIPLQGEVVGAGSPSMLLTQTSVPLSLCSSAICSGFEFVRVWYGLVQGWASSRSLRILQLSRAFTDLRPSSSASMLLEHPPCLCSRLSLRARVLHSLGK